MGNAIRGNGIERPGRELAEVAASMNLFAKEVPEMTYNGKCHCGKIAFDVEGDLTEIIECNCSICYESGYLHWMIDPSQLRIKTPLKDASLYLWGTGQARHYFCPKCGVAVLRNPRTSPDTKFSVNVRCLAGVDVSKLKVTQFDGRNKLKV